jgi:NADH dehydrogenase FAD-containing subunit
MIIKCLSAATAAAVLATSAAAMPPTSLEKAELSMMSPAKQKEVLARATGGNTVDGVIETMLLNQISDEFAQGNVVAVDFDDTVVVVQNKKGQLKRYEFDTLTLTLKDPAKPAAVVPAKP